jgi:uncharacterized phage protein (TIGR01671 family)
MREIKFRAWDTEEKRMVDFSNPKNGIEYCCGDFSVSSGWDSYDCPTYQGEVNAIIMQYTGLKDKNGVEIYEGDVVHYPKSGDGEFVGVVIFNDLSFIVEHDVGGSCLDSGFEVIGNIHENPELLEVKQ